MRSGGHDSTAQQQRRRERPLHGRPEINWTQRPSLGHSSAAALRGGAGLGGTAVLVPDLDKGLGFRITPGQACLFQFVGALAPQFTPFNGPTCYNAAISQRVENRGSRP